jgi:hypothetical protein
MRVSITRYSLNGVSCARIVFYNGYLDGGKRGFSTFLPIVSMELFGETMDKENKYYVYGHHLQCGKLFYVGKGCGKRHSNKYQRPKVWNDFVKGKVWYSSILFDNLSNSASLAKELLVITELKDQLINIKTANISVCESDLKLAFKYDPTSSTGLRWITNRYSGRNMSHVSAKIGDEAGSKSTRGYPHIVCSINSQLFTASRVIWLLEYGFYPDNNYVIDHLNGDSLDNRLENLSLCSQNMNTKNKKIRSDNVTGKTGISFKIDKGRDYCNSSCTINGKIKVKTYSISKHGLLPAFQLACIWRKEQIALLNEQGAGYTERHGT